jgi:hypothetical protein
MREPASAVGRRVRLDANRRLDFDALVRIGSEHVRRDAALRGFFSIRLLEALADLRATGGQVAASSEEVQRQAWLTFAGAVEFAEIPADAEPVEEAYRRLHSDRDRSHATTPMALPASRNSP